MEDVYKLMYTCETLYGPDIMPRMWPYTTIEYHKFYVNQTRKSAPAIEDESDADTVEDDSDADTVEDESEADTVKTESDDESKQRPSSYFDKVKAFSKDWLMWSTNVDD